MKDHPRYLENQRDVNKNLVEMLQKDEGKDVVLYETANDEVGDDGGHRHNDDGGHNDDGAEASSKLEENLEKVCRLLRTNGEINLEFYPPEDEKGI